MIDKSKLYYIDVVKLVGKQKVLDIQRQRSLYGIAIVKVLLVSHDEKQAIVRHKITKDADCAGMIFNEKILFSGGIEKISTCSKIVNCDDLFKTASAAHDAMIGSVCCGISFGDLVCLSELAIRLPVDEKFLHDGIHINDLPWVVTKINKKTGNLTVSSSVMPMVQKQTHASNCLLLSKGS